MSADPTLSWFIDIVERSRPGEARVPVTLWTSGGVITGQLVSSAYYLAKLAAQLGKDLSRFNPEAAADFQLRLEGEAQSSYADLKEEEQRNPDAVYRKSYQFVHLEDTRLVSPNGTLYPPEAIGLLWRGRVDQVAGFIVPWQFRSPPIK